MKRISHAKRSPQLAAAIGTTLLSLFGAAALNTAPAFAQAQVTSDTIRGQIAPVLSNHHPTGITNKNNALHLSIGLSLRNNDELNALLAAQHNPASPQYHQYLTPREFTAEFSPTQATVDSVTSYLRSQGLKVESVASNHLFIDASGNVGTAEKAFNVTINNYDLNGRTVYSPSSDPQIPGTLASAITSITGLDNVAQYHHYAQLQQDTSAEPNTGPGGGYTPSELRTAYDVNSLISNGDDGTGQTVAIFELDGYKSSDITTYLSNYSLGSAKYSNVLVDGATNTAGSGAIEVELDMEDVSAIAPGATQKIYIGPNSTSGVNDTYNKIVTDGTAKVTSTSWGECESASGNAELASLDTIFKEGSAQGQAFFAAAGDAGAYDCGTTTLAVDSPADDPYVVGVGGTTLNTGSGGTYSSESVWGDPSDTSEGPEGAGGGGGVSTYFSRPSYQTGTGLTNANRMVPDVSADADPNTGYSVYCTVTAAGCSSSGWISVGGTSAAAPFWTAMSADINQYLSGQGKAVLGDPHADLYSLYNNSQTYSPYHDITTGNNLHYSATTGYDLASGIGTPDAWNIARDLAGTSGGGGGNNFSISANPTSLSIADGSNGSSTISTAVTSGSAGTVSLTANVSPSGPTAALSPTSVTAGSSSTLTVSVGSSVAAGTYTVTVQGTEGSASHSTSVTVTVSSSGGGGSTTQLLANPGFENGSSPWVESSSGGYELVTTDNPHTGSYSAYLGGYNNAKDEIYQTVTLPSTTTKATLSFWVYIDTQESGSTAYDKLTIRLRTSSGTVISTVKTLSNANAEGWTQYSVDVTSALSSYKGKSVEVDFLGTTDSSLLTDFFVDDVALNATH